VPDLFKKVLQLVDDLTDRLLTGRTLVTLGMVFFAYRDVVAGTVGQVLMSAVLLVLYGSVFWYADRWQKPRELVLVTLVLSVATDLNVFVFHAGWWSVMLFLFLIGFFARRVPGQLAAVLSVLVGLQVLALQLRFGATLQDRLGLIVGIISVYMGMRGYRLRFEAGEVSRAHLEELQKAHSELQEATVKSMQHAVLEERTRIARDIHDSLGHSLTSLIVQLQALQYLTTDSKPEVKEMVSNMLHVARKSLGEIRTSVHALADDKTVVGVTSLRAFVSQVDAHTHLTCRFLAGDDLDLNAQTTVTLYRVLQETLTNAVRHAGATTVTVEIAATAPEVVQMCVRDDGRLQPGDPVVPGFGMKGMLERVAAAGGSLTFAPVEPHGLEVCCTMPVCTQQGSDT
jgi:signal transduction histidine kinase